MATATAKLDEQAPARVQAARAYKAFWLIEEAIALFLIWLDSLFLPLFGIYSFFTHNYPMAILVTVILGVGHKHHARTFADNVRDTYKRMIRLSWRLSSTEEWTYPQCEAITLKGFVGIREAIRLVVSNKGRGIPYQEFHVWVRRANSQGAISGQDKWLDGMADFLRRKYRYASSEPQPDPTDANRDVIVLTHQMLSDYVGTR